MISKLAFVLAEHFSERNMYQREEISIYTYGFELLISTVVNLLGILCIALFMGVVVEAVCFCLAFIPLRVTAGGYHAKRHWSCITGFNAIFLVFALLQGYMHPEFVLPYSLAAIAVSSLLIWALSPVAAANKPLSKAKQERQREKSLILACINMAVTLSFFAVPAIRDYSSLLAWYNSGALAASASLAAAVAVSKTTDPPAAR
ncbi:MAG: accessory gene regulator B family protein [Peptococcaceae bacterium]|jgi:accessory gene regulator B|nr:accessory gene regulator B family protein [Peptococcaceae bacterium]